MVDSGWCAGAEAFSEASAQRHYPPDLSVEPVHLDLDLAIDLKEQRIEGVVTTTVRANRGGVAHLSLDGVGLQLRRVWDPDRNQLAYEYDGETLKVCWDDPLDATQQRKLCIDYQVQNPIAGFYFSRPSEQYPDLFWYAATDHETERARYWLPCVDLPNARPMLDLHITTDARFTVLANGQLVGRQAHNDQTRTTHWRLGQACPSYLVCLAIGEFIEAKQSPAGSIPVSFFSTPRHTPQDLERSFGMTGRMLEWIQAKLGQPYPYPKYYQLALPALDGAMENISLVTWTDQAVLNQELAKERGRVIDSVNVHEMAHAYFGNLVVCRDFAHVWLKESWATYMEQCWYEDAHGEDEALYQYFRNASAYFKEADEQYQRPIVTRIFQSSMDMYDRHLYPGGACRIHMLRQLLGDEVFWPAVKRYLERYGNRVVETDDFRHVMEESSGMSLIEFFELWFMTPGYPCLKVTFEFEPDDKRGIFTVEQKPPKHGEDLKPFSFLADLMWSVDGREYLKEVELSRPYQQFPIEMPSSPEQVRFDPRHRVLHKLEFNPGGQRLRRQLSEAVDVIGRIQAAEVLMATGLPENIEAVVRAARTERFWGVRVEFARLLGEAHTDAAMVGIIGWLYEETDPRVLEALVDASGKYQDERIRDTLVDCLEQGLPYRSRAAAYRALGAQGELAPLEVLADACRVEDHSGYIQGSAFLGLARSRHRDALRLLLGLVAPGGVPSRARHYLIQALGELGTVLDGGDRERLLRYLGTCLRDSDWRVAREAAKGMCNMGAQEGLRVLLAYRSRLAHQDQVALDRLLDKLKANTRPSGVRLERELEAMQRKYRELEKRLARIEGSIEHARP